MFIVLVTEAIIAALVVDMVRNGTFLLGDESHI
jgi:hypothetical protein